MISALLYFFSFVLVDYYARANIRNVRKRLRFESIACFLLMFVILGFRDLYVLNDTAHYYEHFQNVLEDRKLSFSTLLYYDVYDRFSPGYLIYERIIGVVFSDPYMIICASALIITITFIYFARLHTTRISLLLFMCLTTYMLSVYSGLRQGLATCFFIFALIALERNRIFFYYFLVIIAISFHTSAFLLLIVPLLKKIPLNRLTIFATVLVNIIVAIGIDYFLFFAGFGESEYVETNNARKALPIASILNSLVLLFILFVSYLIKRNNHVKLDERTQLYWWLSLLSLFFSVLDTQFLIMARFCMYFNVVVYMLFLCNLSNIVQVRKRKLYTIFVIFFLMLRMAIILIARPEWYHIDNYDFYDFNKVVHETNYGY